MFWISVNSSSTMVVLVFTRLIHFSLFISVSLTSIVPINVSRLSLCLSLFLSFQSFSSGMSIKITTLLGVLQVQPNSFITLSKEDSDIGHCRYCYLYFIIIISCQRNREKFPMNSIGGLRLHILLLG